MTLYTGGAIMSIKNLTWIGGLFLVVAAFFFVREQMFLSKAETASGTVTGFIAGSTSSDGTSSSLCPLIQFTTSDGQSIEYKGNVCTRPPFWQPGDAVEVVYDPQNLDRIQIRNIFSQYLLVLIFGLFGVVCLAIW